MTNFKNLSTSTQSAIMCAISTGIIALLIGALALAVIAPSTPLMLLASAAAALMAVASYRSVKSLLDIEDERDREFVERFLS